MRATTIHPFAVGRRNWLFIDTRAGAEAIPILYSLVETAKTNAHEPFAYLSYVIAIAPTSDDGRPVDRSAPLRNLGDDVAVNARAAAVLESLTLRSNEPTVCGA